MDKVYYMIVFNGNSGTEILDYKDTRCLYGSEEQAWEVVIEKYPTWSARVIPLSVV